jgi:hypothetical protein
MNKIKLREYKVSIEAAMRETRQAINDAIELINNHEDGPATMRSALNEIEQYLSNVETEVSCMEHSYQDVLALMARVNGQRDEALKQRNIALRQLKIEQKHNRDLKRWC